MYISISVFTWIRDRDRERLKEKKFQFDFRKAFHLIDKHSFDDRLFNNLLNSDNKNPINSTKLSVVYI